MTKTVDTVQHEEALVEGFRNAFRRHPGGVALVTADSENGPVAMTITSLSSVGIDPPLVMFSASERSSSTPTLRSAERISIHLLGADDLALAQVGSTSGIDRFDAGEPWTRAEDGVPYFHQASIVLHAQVERRLQVPGATIVVASVIGLSEARPAAEALVYHDRTWHRLSAASTI